MHFLPASSHRPSPPKEAIHKHQGPQLVYSGPIDLSIAEPMIHACNYYGVFVALDLMNLYTPGKIFQIHVNFGS